MDLVEISTSLRLGELRCQGYNSKRLVKVRERLWSWLKKNNADCLCTLCPFGPLLKQLMLSFILRGQSHHQYWTILQNLIQ